MKKLYILLTAICLSAVLQAAVLKTVNCTSAGTLHNYFTVGERTTVTDLTLTGTIDARDFKFIRDTIVNLISIDLSAVNIAAYSGTAGTLSSSYWDYAANAIPGKAFARGMFVSQVASIKLPLALVEIGDGAFEFCSHLVSIIIPQTVTKIFGGAIFEACSNLKYIQFNNPTPPPLDGLPDGLEYLGYGLPNKCYIVVNNGDIGGFCGPASYGLWGLCDYPQFVVLPGTIEQYWPGLAVNQTSIDKLNITTNGTSAVISGLTIGETLTIYNLQGTPIYNQQAQAETVTVSLPAHGIYVVRVGEVSVKVVY